MKDSHPHGTRRPRGKVLSIRRQLRASTFVSLQVRNFQWYFSSSVTFFMAMQMQQIGRGWLVYELTESPLALGIIMLSFASPMAVFSLLGGALADRLPKVKLIVAVQSVNAVLVIILAVLIHTELVVFWHLVAFGLLNGSVMALQVPSRLTLVTEIVPERRMMNAIALNTSGQNLARIIGPAIAGIVIAVFETATVFYLIAGIYVFSILCVSRVKVRSPLISKSRGVIQQIAEGLRYTTGDPTLRNLLVLGFFSSLIGIMAFQSLMPAWSVEALGLGAEGLGLLLAIMGVGAVVGSLLVASLSSYKRRGLLLLATAFSWAIFILIFSQAGNLPLALIWLVFIGFLSAIFLSLNQSLTQIHASPEMRGRTMSLNAMSWGLMPLGALPIGALAEEIGTPNALSVSAIILVVFVIGFTMLNPWFRKLK